MTLLHIPYSLQTSLSNDKQVIKRGFLTKRKENVTGSASCSKSHAKKGEMFTNNEPQQQEKSQQKQQQQQKQQEQRKKEEKHKNCKSLSSNIRWVVTLIGALIHTFIAVIVYFHVRNDFGVLEDNRPPSPNFDLLLSVCYYTTLDATLVVLQVNRAAIRAWHWKINTTIIVPGLIMYFASFSVKPVFLAMYVILMKFMYSRLKRCDGISKVYRIGLDKYKKEAPSTNLHYRYPILTLLEAYLVSKHHVCFLSPILFVMLDAAWSQMTTKRSKISDLWFISFTSSMETGQWMCILNHRSGCDPKIEILGLVIYLLLQRVLVTINDGSIKEVYSIINNKWRFFSMFATFALGLLTGSHKHVVFVGGFNLCSNLLIFYTASDMVPILLKRVATPRFLNGEDN